MKRKLGFMVILFLTVLSMQISFAGRDESMQLSDGFFIPTGDPQAGLAAFSELKCTSCHWVTNNTELNIPTAEKLGPLLGAKQAGYSVGWLANSIVSPSHTIAVNSDGESDESELSRMGDFSEIMTVRQMIDLVAYLKSLKEDNSVEPV